MPNIETTGAYLPTSLTFGEAKARVARVVQGASQANTLEEAGEAIGDAFRWWNRRDWQCLRTIAPDINVSANVSDYDLPTGFKHAYSVRLSQDPLAQCSQRDWDRLVWDQSGQLGATHYTTIVVGSQNKIRLIPTPDDADTLQVIYYRALTLPAKDQDTLTIPDVWVDPILDYARARLAAERGKAQQREFFYAQAIKGYREARRLDLVEPDYDTAMQPAPSNANPPGSTWYYVRDHYGF